MKDWNGKLYPSKCSFFFNFQNQKHKKYIVFISIQSFGDGVTFPCSNNHKEQEQGFDREQLQHQQQLNLQQHQGNQSVHVNMQFNNSIHPSPENQEEIVQENLEEKSIKQSTANFYNSFGDSHSGSLIPNQEPNPDSQRLDLWSNLTKRWLIWIKKY